jgi:hypothetical protein
MFKKNLSKIKEKKLLFLFLQKQKNKKNKFLLNSFSFILLKSKNNIRKKAIFQNANSVLVLIL